MSGMENGPYWMLALLVVLAVGFGCFFVRESHLYDEARGDWRDRGVRDLLDGVADETGAEIRQIHVRPYDQERDQ